MNTLLDSGAFVASRRGLQPCAEEYAAYLHRNAARYVGYFNLDVIPTSAAKAEESAETSWVNYLHLRDEGLDPISVYHFGERWYWLEKMIDEGCQYIGIGGIARVSPARRLGWLKEIFARVPGHVRLHGLGVTGMDELHLPWRSVDSSAWVKYAAYGSIFVGRPNPRDPPLQVCVTADATHRRSSFYQLGHNERSYVERYIAGFDLKLEDLQGEKGREGRSVLNAGYYWRVAKVRKVSIYFVDMEPAVADRLSAWTGEEVGTLVAYNWKRK